MQRHFVVAVAGAAEVRAPFVGDDLDFRKPELLEVGFDHFGGAERVGEIGARIGHDFEAQRMLTNAGAPLVVRS